MKEMIQLLSMKGTPLTKLGTSRTNNNGHIGRTPWNMHGIYPIRQGFKVTNAGFLGHIAIIVGTGEGDDGDFHIVFFTVGEFGGIAKPEGEGAGFDGVEPGGGNDAEVGSYPGQNLQKITLHMTPLSLIHHTPRK
jgi:hypothetical protein